MEQRPVVADFYYTIGEDKTVSARETIVRVVGDGSDGVICIQFAPEIKKDDSIFLFFKPGELMQALTAALAEL